MKKKSYGCKTFRQWLKTKQDEDNPVGDFSTDVDNDSTFPWNSGYREQVHYLKIKDADSDALIAHNEAWKRWLDYVLHGDEEES